MRFGRSPLVFEVGVLFGLFAPAPPLFFIYILRGVLIANGKRGADAFFLVLVYFFGFFS